MFPTDRELAMGGSVKGSISLMSGLRSDQPIWIRRSKVGSRGLDWGQASRASAWQSVPLYLEMAGDPENLHMSQGPSLPSQRCQPHPLACRRECAGALLLCSCDRPLQASYLCSL
jgi:hypothetical protein